MGEALQQTTDGFEGFRKKVLLLDKDGAGSIVKEGTEYMSRRFVCVILPNDNIQQIRLSFNDPEKKPWVHANQ